MLIGIVGRARHGKNTVAEAIISESFANGLTAKVYSLSDLMLEECQLEGTIPINMKREDCTAGNGYIAELVRMGEAKRQQNPFYWIGSANRIIQEECYDVAVVPNIRFQNEADWISIYGFLIRVTRLNADGSVYISLDRNPNDVTETEQERIVADYNIVVRPDQIYYAQECAAAILDLELDKNTPLE